MAKTPKSRSARVRISDHIFGDSSPPYIIAEIGVNHDGSRDRARELITIAASAGANAVKFQYFTAERLLSNASRLANYQRETGASDPLSMLQRLELSEADVKSLAEFAWASGVHPIVTLFSVEHAPLARTISWAAIKVASPDIINRPLIEAVAASDRPIILSTGASSLDEVNQAAAWINGPDFAVMQCVSAYPTPNAMAALGAIGDLKQAIGVPVGYSDHTADELTGGLAIAAGACFLEKHITYDRNAKGPDHAMSLEPVQFRRYVNFAKQAAEMRGSVQKSVLPIELDVREVSRQSVVVTRDLESGAVLGRADLTIKRPGGGVAPARLDELIGRRLLHHIGANELLTDAHVDWHGTMKSQAQKAKRAAQAA
jgi:sialic acid synthase SpsE